MRGINPIISSDQPGDPMTLFFMMASRANYDFFRASFRSASIPRSMTRSSAA